MNVSDGKPGVDVIVVNYRTPEDLAGFLGSFDPTGVPQSLTVVNVDPTPEDVKVVHLNGKWVERYIEIPENVGYARAVNRAVAETDREIIAIFNADTKLFKDTINLCHNALQCNDSWGILGPRQVDSQGRITHGGIFQHERGFHQWDSPEFGDIREDATTVSGSAYFIKRTVWEELTACPQNGQAEGAFLPTQHYFEETWCSYHARAHNHTVVYYGPVTMLHEWHRASPRGGHADQQVSTSQQMFIEACEAHDIRL